MKRLLNARVMLLLVLTVLPGRALVATEKASGTFVASQECELYQSKRKKTNPGELTSEPGRSYPIREAIVGGNTVEWLRVETGDSQMSLRWVEASCGTSDDFSLGRGDTGVAGGGSSDCQTPGIYDAHVLAISWQPAFCEQKRDKAECVAINSQDGEDLFASSHFALHGLWPNRDECGTRYGFCGSVKRRPSGSFCNYPDLELSETFREELGEVMPSAVFGTCLERHEWWKHGTCRSDEAEPYYRLAMTLLAAINESSFVEDFIQERIDSQVVRDELLAAFDAAFGEGAHTRLRLSCSGGRLTEIQVSLPEELKVDASFEDLLSAAAETGRGNCGSQFELDAAGL